MVCVDIVTSLKVYETTLREESSCWLPLGTAPVAFFFLSCEGANSYCRHDQDMYAAASQPPKWLSGVLVRRVAQSVRPCTYYHYVTYTNTPGLWRVEKRVMQPTRLLLQSWSSYQGLQYSRLANELAS